MGYVDADNNSCICIILLLGKQTAGVEQLPALWHLQQKALLHQSIFQHIP